MCKFVAFLVLSASIGALAWADDSTWRAHMEAAYAAFQRRDFADAKTNLETALTEAEEFGPDDPRVAVTLSQFVDLYRAQRKYGEAIPYYQRLLAIMEKAPGPESTDYASGLNNLAALYKEQGQFAQAEPLYERALAIEEKAKGPNHPDVARRLHNLAEIYREQGKYAQADALSRRSAAANVGEVSVQSTTPPDNRSLLHVYREATFVGSAARVQVLIDGVRVLTHLPQGSVLTVELDPGDHTLEMTIDRGQAAKMALTLNPQQTYFVKQSWSLFKMSLELVPEAEARAELTNAKSLGVVRIPIPPRETQDAALQRIAEVIEVVTNNYVDPIPDAKLVAGCRGGILRQIGARSSLPEAGRIDSTDPKAGLREIAGILDSVEKQNPGFTEWYKLADACLQGLLEGLDKRSAYLDDDAFKELQVGSAPLGGIGIETRTEEGFVKIVSTIEGTPAERARLKTGDVITKIGDDSLKGLSLKEVVKRLRGKPGTTVRLEILRTGEQKPLEFELTREVIRVQTVRWGLIPGGYVNLRISQFQVATVERLATALRAAHRDNLTGLRGVVLDLRNNPGGLLTACVGVSAAFLPASALVVATKGRSQDSSRQWYARAQDYVRGRGTDPLKDLPDSIKVVPITVIVNRASAACSEIVAAALQDHGRAKVLGERTFGQGTVQTIAPLAELRGFAGGATAK